MPAAAPPEGPRLLVVQHDADKPLGIVGDALAAAGARLDVHMADGPLPAVAGYDGLAVLPGIADPIDDDPAVHRARATIVDALDDGLPVLGICLGGQLLAQALGGTAGPCALELGYHPVRATAATADDPLLAAAAGGLVPFHAHAFAFTAPPGATVLLENDVCVQAVRVGEAWALQCHPEIDPDWAVLLAAAIRGEATPLEARTVAFFARNGVDPVRLAEDARATAAAARRVAAGIGTGFAERCRQARGRRSTGAGAAASTTRSQTA